MANKNDLACFDFVRYEGDRDLYCVLEVEPDPPHRGLIGIASRAHVCQGRYVEDNAEKLAFVSAQKLDKLPPVKVTKETVRSFLRMEKNAWELAESGLFPFAEDSETYHVSCEDMLASLQRFFDADEVTRSHLCEMDDELSLFDDPDAEELYEILLGAYFNLIGWFDPEEDDPVYLNDLISFIKENEGHTAENAVISESYAVFVCSYIDGLAPDELTDALRILYKRVMDTPTETQEEWRLYHRAYAYYGGNGVVDCDWHKSAESLQQYYDRFPQDREMVANSLGYIYYSNRLGKPDYDKAFSFFSEAAALGNMEAQYKLSDMYRKGHGTPVDGAKALQLLKPLYEQELDKHRRGNYGSKLADTALRMGYCARDGIGRERNLRDAYCLFMQAKNAILVRRAKKDHFGDGTVEANIDRALSELADVYSPESESYVGLIGKTDEIGGLQRCLADDGDTLLLRSVNDRMLETRMPRQRFSPITEHAHDAGDMVTIIKGHKPAVVRSASWHFNRGTMSYLLTIDGKESGKWYFEWELENE